LVQEREESAYQLVIPSERRESRNPWLPFIAKATTDISTAFAASNAANFPQDDSLVLRCAACSHDGAARELAAEGEQNGCRILPAPIFIQRKIQTSAHGAKKTAGIVDKQGIDFSRGKASGLQSRNRA
jgi:hypothetical protein